MNYEVDPTALPTAMSREQLEWWIIFSICVAGKSAKQTEAKVNAFLDSITIPNFWENASPAAYTVLNGPFCKLAWVLEGKKSLMPLLKKYKVGQYGRINKALRLALHLDLQHLTIEALEAIPGIGPKTARMILMYGVEGNTSKYAVLDTHILKWLRKKYSTAPKSTPSGAKYLYWEERFLSWAAKLGKTPKELDTEIWLSYAKK